MARKRKAREERAGLDFPSPEWGQRLGVELLAVCLTGLRPYGVDTGRLIKATTQQGTRRPRAAYSRKLLSDVHWLGELAAEWSGNPQFVDEMGRPRILPIEGRDVTFDSLVRRYFGPGQTRRILELALRTGVAERVGDAQVAQVNVCVMLNGQPALLLARAILCVRGLLEATRRNAFSKDRRDGLAPDRLALSYVPREKFNEFAAQMRPQIHNVTEQGNRWLTEHTVRDRPRELERSAGLMGIHAYVFSD